MTVSTETSGSLYDVLQVRPTASDKQLDKAYQRLRRERGTDKAAFESLKHAYRTLSSKSRRAAYDTELSGANTRLHPGSGFSKRGPPAPARAPTLPPPFVDQPTGMATPVLPRGLAATPLATKPAHLPLLAEQHRGGGNVARAPRPFSLLGLGRSQPQPTAPPPTPRAPVARAQQQQAQVQPQGPSPLSGNLAGRKAVEAWSAGVSGVVRAGIGASGAAARPSTAQVREDDPWAALDDGKRRAAIAHDRRCQAEYDRLLAAAPVPSSYDSFTMTDTSGVPIGRGYIVKWADGRSWTGTTRAKSSGALLTGSVWSYS